MTMPLGERLQRRAVEALAGRHGNLRSVAQAPRRRPGPPHELPGDEGRKLGGGIHDHLGGGLAGARVFETAPRGPSPVGRGATNDYGLSDVGTVVREWCLDWYAPDAYQSARRYDPRGPETGERRVRRGSSWRQGSWEAPSHSITAACTRRTSGCTGRSWRPAPDHDCWRCTTA